MTRYPFADLERLIAAPTLDAHSQVAPTAFVADMLGVHRRHVSRLRDTGLSADQADRYAVAAGYHPWEIWPELADHTIADLKRPCDNCADTFVPVRRDQRFCCTRCNRRWWGREIGRRRVLTDEQKERKRAQRRAYYAECGDYERARQRAYNRRRREAAA